MTYLSPAAEKAQHAGHARARLWQPTIGLSDSGQWFYVAHALRNRHGQRQRLTTQMQAAGFKWDGRAAFKRYWRRATSTTATALAAALTLKDPRTGQPVLHCWHATITDAARRKLDALLQPPEARDQAVPISYPRGRSVLFKS